MRATPVLSALAIVSAAAGVALFLLHSFAYLPALAIAAIFALGAVASRLLQRTRL